MPDYGLKNVKLSEAYKSLLRVDNNTSGISGASLRQVTDGEGSKTALYISDRNLKIQPETDDSELVHIKNVAGDDLLIVDSSSNFLKGIGGEHLNTQYQQFGVNYEQYGNLAAGYHYFVPNGIGGFASATNDTHLGNGANPTTTFTTANTDGSYASQLVNHLWYLPDKIYIDSITTLGGASAATGDTYRLHCLSFDFNSGSTSALTNGLILANSGTDTVNAGNEQPYKTLWSFIDTPHRTVNAQKVIAFTFEQDGINSDYSVQIIVKYHLI